MIKRVAPRKEDKAITVDFFFFCRNGIWLALSLPRVLTRELTD